MFLANSIIIQHKQVIRSVCFGNLFTKTTSRSGLNYFQINPFVRRVYTYKTKSLPNLLWTSKQFASHFKRFSSNAKQELNNVTNSIKNTKKQPSDWQRLLSLGKKEKWIMLAAVSCLIVSSSITMSVPFAVGKMLDLITDNNFSRDTIFNFCAILCGTFVVGAVANFGRVYLINGASKLNILMCTSIFIHFFVVILESTSNCPRFTK